MTPGFTGMDVGRPLTARQKAQVESIMDTVGPTLDEIEDPEVLVSIAASVMMTCAMRFDQPGRFLDDARGFVDLALARMREMER